LPWRLQMMLMLQTRSVPTILMWRKPFNASHIVSFRTDTLPHSHHSISDQLISQFFLTVIDNLLTSRELEEFFLLFKTPILYQWFRRGYLYSVVIYLLQDELKNCYHPFLPHFNRLKNHFERVAALDLTMDSIFSCTWITHFNGKGDFIFCVTLQ